MWLFIPTICACVKYRFLWKAQRASSAFPPKCQGIIGYSRCCVQRGVCTINYFKFEFFSSAQHQIAQLPGLWVCSRGLTTARSLANVLRWRNSLCTESVHVPLQLLLHPAVFHISPPLFLLPFFLTHIEMKDLLQDDGCCLAVIQATHLPDCCSSFFSTPPTVLVQLSDHFRVCLKVCRCVS